MNRLTTRLHHFAQIGAVHLLAGLFLTQAALGQELLQLRDEFVDESTMFDADIDNYLDARTNEDDALKQVLFPDEAVVGGVEPAIVGYADPGIELGRLLLREVDDYQQRLGRSPRVVLLKNHGVVTFGRSAQEVKAATFMATKAARVRLGALAAGGLSPLPPGAAEHLGGRSDEQARLTNLFGPQGAADDVKR